MHFLNVDCYAYQVNTSLIITQIMIFVESNLYYSCHLFWMQKDMP